MSTGEKRRQEAAAAARAAEDARRRRERTVRLTAVVAVLVLVAAGVVFAVVRSRVDPAAGFPKAVQQQGGGIVVGPAAGTVPVLDIYEDFQCPYCKQFEATNSATVEQYAKDGKVRAVYHPVSFLGAESVRAANAAGCASDAGVFSAFHDLLYANQPREGTGGYTPDDLVRFGKQAGATSSSFEQCVRGSAYADWVKAVEQDFDKKFNQTPTVLLDGKQVDVSPLLQDPAGLRRLLDTAAR